MSGDEVDGIGPAGVLIDDPLNIVRYTDRTVHLSPDSREKEIDVMVENPGDVPVESF